MNVLKFLGWTTLPLLMAQVSPQAAQSVRMPDITGRILTVAGPIDPAELGPTLMHEHIILDYSGGNRRQQTATEKAAYDKPVSLKNLSALRAGLIHSRDNLMLTDIDLAIREVSFFKRWGGKSIVDVTSFGLGRDARALLQVSNATGLHVVMGTGYYVKQFHPPEMDSYSVDDLAEIIIRDIAQGVDGTSIRAGIIGEVGIGGNPLTENEMKSVRASARASRATGAAISFHHGGFWEEKFVVLDAVEGEGVDPGRVIIGHANHIAANLPFMRRLLERGVYIQFDLLGEVIPRLGRIHDAEVAQAIVELVRAGFGDRILLSQDVCTKVQLKAYGGMGYSYIMEFVLPELRRLGLTDGDLDRMMVSNPQRVLAFAKPGR